MADAVPNTSRSISPDTIQMSADEKFLFDLTGYLLVRDVLTPEQLRLGNEAIDMMGELEGC
jgi:hypothetical protein